MAQTVHATEMPVARAGHVADLSNTDIISRLAEDAAGAGAGRLVVAGTDAENQAVAPTATGDVTGGDALGVVKYDATKEPARTAAALAAGNEFDIEDTLPVVQKGRVWVLCDAGATIVANTAAFVRFASGAGGSVLGAFRQNADTATAVALPNAKFVSSHRDVNFNGVTQRIALVDLDLPTL